MPFLEQVLKTFKISADLLDTDELSVQRNLANILRQAAINHLRTSSKIIAKSFRGEYIASGLGHYKDFLQEQGKNTVWGTYIEATALGEALDCHVVVTPIKGTTKQAPICLYRSENANAPTVHLYNSNNTHWYVNDKTRGDGNCLYNAFAQALQTIVQPTLPKKVLSPLVSQSIYQTKDRETREVIFHQQQISKSILRHPRPSQMESELNAEQKRVAKLSKVEQKQITDDYALALELAKEELRYDKAKQRA